MRNVCSVCVVRGWGGGKDEAGENLSAPHMTTALWSNVTEEGTEMKTLEAKPS